ncbi:hypothetical protein [Roseibium album]|uniref:hypothetical protein n=1 Tax=Roseibium album TaxID=311410 RepID=UPI00391D7AB2
MKLPIRVSANDLMQLEFRAVPAGDDIMLVARVNQEQFDTLCAQGAAFEDWEDDGHGEDDGNTEAVMTTDGYNS